MEASCTIAKVRHLSKVFQFLSRVGEEVFLIATANSLELQVINSGETALAKVSFVVDSFFSKYTFDKKKMQKQQEELTQNVGSRIYNNGFIHARMNAKHLLMAFRVLNDVKYFTIEIRVDEAKFCFNLEQENGIKRLYKFNINEGSSEMDVDPTDTKRKLNCHPNTFLDLLKHLSAKQMEIRLELAEEGVTITSELENGQCTTLNIQEDDFESFERYNNNDYWRSFTVKEFKSVLQLIDILGCTATVNLPDKEEPLYCENAEEDVCVKVQLLLAVQSPDMMEEMEEDDDEEEESMVYSPPGGYSFQSEVEAPKPKKRPRPSSQSKPRFGSQKRRKVNGGLIFPSSQQQNQQELEENIFKDHPQERIQAGGSGTPVSQDWSPTQRIPEHSIPSSLTQDNELSHKNALAKNADTEEEEEESSPDLFA